MPAVVEMCTIQIIINIVPFSIVVFVTVNKALYHNTSQESNMTFVVKNNKKKNSSERCLLKRHPFTFGLKIHNAISILIIDTKTQTVPEHLEDRP